MGSTYFFFFLIARGVRGCSSSIVVYDSLQQEEKEEDERLLNETSKSYSSVQTASFFIISQQTFLFECVITVPEGRPRSRLQLGALLFYFHVNIFPVLRARVSYSFIFM